MALAAERPQATAAAPGPSWSWPTGPRHAWRIRRLLRILTSQRARGPLLDVGCGRGTLAIGFARRGGQALAFDVSASAVRRCRDAAWAAGVGESVWTFVADGTAIPLGEASLPLACAGEVLEHIARDARCAHEIARVLAPGGAVAITVPSGSQRYGPLDRAAGHARRYDRAQLAALLAHSGLTLEVLRGWGFPFGRLYECLVLRRIGRIAEATVPPRCAAAMVLEQLFELESHWPAGRLGAGWLAVARKPIPSPSRSAGAKIQT